MLTLGPNSTCDVCLEHFGVDHKAPHSICCGHVFCLDCVRRISPAECPLCRTPYVPGKWRKLHVDMSALCHTGTEKEARRLQEAFGEVTTLGSSEANSRQLINECRNFLQTQPRSMYGDLRAACRLLTYLCDVKANLRSQNVEVESLKAEISQLVAEKEELESLQYLKGEIVQLEADKSELQIRLEALEAARDKDKQFAIDLDSKLKEHVIRSESSYQALSHFNSIIQGYACLNEELKAIGSKVLNYTRSAGEDICSSSWSGSDSGEYAPSTNQSPDSYMSSVPELTDGSSAYTVPFSSTPELRAEGRHGEMYSRRKLKRCDAVEHSASCQCDSSPDSPPATLAPQIKRPSVPKPTFIIEHPVRRRESISVPINTAERPSGLSRSAPKHQEFAPAPSHARLRSFSDVPPIPSPQSRHHDKPHEERQPPSDPISRSPSPDHVTSADLRHEGSALGDNSPSENIRRLYNILQKPQPQPEGPQGYLVGEHHERDLEGYLATLPELPSNLNSVQKLRHRTSQSPSRSRSGSVTSLQANPVTAQTSAAGNASQVMHAQPPSNVISRASDAAMAIERSQKEKALKEKERGRERREHRKLEKEVERLDVDRISAESDRTARKLSASTSGALSNYPTHTQQASPYHPSGLSSSPHHDTHIAPPPAHMPPQKVPNPSAFNTLGRKDSVKMSSTNYSRLGSDSQRDGNAPRQPPSNRHGTGSSKTATSSNIRTTPIPV